MTHTTHRGRALIAAALLLCTLPLGLAACSTSSTGGDTVADSSAGVGAAWGSCMREAGFDVEDPDDALVESGMSRTPAGVDGQEFSKASSVCSQKAGVERSSSAELQKWERQYAKVASCIRDHGYDDFPEQQAGGLSTEGYARAEEPEFDRVFRDCLAEFSPDTQVQGGN